MISSRLGRPIRILVLEDVATDAELAVRELRRSEIACTSFRVEAPEEFRRALHDFGPDVVLADYSLPQMTALDALHMVKEEGRDLPFVLFTGSQSEEIAVRCMRAGADDYVLKTSLRRLPAAITNALERHLARREHAHMEGALRQSEEQLRLITDHTLDLICILDPDGAFLYANPSAHGILGRAPDTLAGTAVLGMIHPDDRPRAERALLHPPPHGEFRNMAFRIGHADGTWRTVEASGRWIADHAGTDRKIVLVARDITERVRLEAQLRQSQKMEEIGTLAGGIAHDFNNLLGIILGHAYLLDKKVPHEGRERESIDAINTTVRRGTNLVRQLLTFARKSEGSFEPVGLAPTITELAAMLRETLPRQITILLDVAPDLPPVPADQNQIHQALLNLCLNARDAMPNGGTLTLGAQRTPPTPGPAPDSPGGWVCLRVSDTGTGMDEQIRARLFEPFFTTKEPGKGTGLGLAVVYGIVRSHHGRIEVDTAPGKGSTFRIFLPAPDLPLAPPAADAAPGTAGSPGTALLVEDEPLLLHLLSAILTEAGWTLHTASDGEAALELFLRHAEAIDVVISDVGLPGIGGLEAFARMRALHPHVRGVFASGYFDPAVRHRVGRDGIVALIQKPYRPAEILEAAAEALASVRAARGGRGGRP